MEKNEGGVSLQKRPSEWESRRLNRPRDVLGAGGRGLPDLPVATCHAGTVWGQAGRPQLSVTHVLPIFLMGVL